MKKAPLHGIHRLFTTEIFQGSLGLSTSTREAILQTALKLPEMDQAGVKWCKKNYPNGYTSYSSLSKLHEQFSPFAKLKAKLDAKVQEYTRRLGLQFETGELVLSNLWVNVMPKNCYHAFHIHPLSVVSGTFYASVEKTASSPLRVEDPRAALFMASPPRKIQVDLHPKSGDVILFESWLKHEVPPHQGQGVRVSVSFNYDWVQR
jgi:uncharacterized protein (TIGR02466 family)